MASGDSTFRNFCYWFTTLLAWGSIAFIGIAHGVPLDKNARTVSIIVLSICLLIYYITQFCSSSCSYLCNRSESASIYNYMEKMFYTPMYKRMHIQCYHYETRTSTYRDSNGNTQIRTQQVRVNTYSCYENYYYRSWRDISGRFDLDLSGGMEQQERAFVKLRLKLFMRLAEDGTATDFEYQKSSFIIRNHRDMFYDFSETLVLDGHKEHILVKVTDYDPPCFNSFWFILFTLLTFAEFYKLHMDKYTIVQNFDIVKIVSSRFDLNAPQYVQEYITLTPCIIYMGQSHQYNGPMVLPPDALTPPPPPPANAQIGQVPGMPANVQINMGPQQQPGFGANVRLETDSPLLQH